MNKPLRIGVLGAARITPNALIEPAKKLPDVAITAIAARNRNRAETFARKHGIEHVHDDYVSLLNDPDIDAIYNPLPNSLHCEWSIRALEAGKHVLCEKPLAANTAQAKQMQAAATKSDRVLAEAFHWRYHPLADRMTEIIAGGEIGRVRHVEASMCFPLFSSKDIRWQYDLAGGALMDVGCYPLSIVRYLVGQEPRVTNARAALHSSNVDRLIEIELEFPNQVTGFVRGSMWSKHLLQIRAKVVGDQGELIVSNPVMPHLFNSIKVKTATGTRKEKVRGASTYHYQLQAFRNWINGGASMATDANHGVANMTIIDEAYLKAGLPLRGHSSE